MLAGGGLIEREMNVLYYLFESFMCKREHELVNVATKPLLLNNKELSLFSKLACGVLKSIQ